MRLRRFVIMVAGLASLSLPLATAQADGFYKGKLFTIVVGFSPGGGYDTYARVVSRHIGKRQGTHFGSLIVSFR